ncbi:MAG: 15-cis-phytoene synthase [Chthoniobacter sp.]|nr:15-cis-phytoene synthase [Chthoniobacter sp.]
MNDAAHITRASKSNLALAFFSLSRERRRDMQTFYAFCRVVDDIADSRELTMLEKDRRIALWRKAITERFAGEPPLARDVRQLIEKYKIPRLHFHEILAGVAMDIMPGRFGNFDELGQYCYRVASVVGLVSIEIFGYRNPACKDYAIDLGIALQLTNIIRDVGEDFANDRRIYLPREDMEKFGYTPEDLTERCEDDRFLALMQFEAERAATFYEKAIASLPPEDRKAMLPAEIMREVYARLLAKIRDGGFHVLQKKYRLSRMEKLSAILSALMSTFS